MSEVEKVIWEVLQRVLGNIPEKEDENILRFVVNSDIEIVNLVYVFEELEKKMHIPVTSVLEKRTYSVLSVRGLAKAIVDDFGLLQVMQNIKEEKYEKIK